MALHREEISLIVSSDPEAGAVRRSADGSQFSIQMDDGIFIPKDARNVKVSVEESSVWWTIPNIITDVNDKMYLTGPSAATDISNVALGYPPGATFIISTNFLTISAIIGIDAAMPLDVWHVGDSFRVDSGSLATNLYVISAVVSNGTHTQIYTITPTTDNQASGVNTFSRIRALNDIRPYVVVIPQGLYDLHGLNQTIARELEALGSVIQPEPLITMTADSATQRVAFRFNYPTSSVDFTQGDTFRDLLGFDSNVYSDVLPGAFLVPGIAAFGSINFFLIHSDLVQEGIRFNNSYNQTISQVLVSVLPGSQIVTQPFNPAVIQEPALIGQRRLALRFWLTDDKNQAVNTNGEYFSIRISIKYLRP
jgi:hypothetical protein